ncbi:MAG TPA: hypothetical protein VKL61_04975 [Candidatus Polarisedimenticolia bacterium]|nr:hypothetical protein [Candidatus Polarisedimenticolia bacterium]
MAKRHRTHILLLFLALATLVECNKSEGSKPANIFGATPQVSNVVITKVRKTFHCEEIVILCSVDPGCVSRFPFPCPLCDCCCKPDERVGFDVDQDLVTATAKVQDQDGVSNILVVILRFLDNVSTGSSSLPQQVSLEMFDTGSVDLVPDPGVQLSGDLTAGDGIYTRSFYLTNSTAQSAGTCVEDTDQTNQGGTFSSYQSNTSTSPSDSKEFRFTIQAIDLQGNIGSGPEIPLPIQGTFRDRQVLAQRGCGAPNCAGGCASTTGPL